MSGTSLNSQWLDTSHITCTAIIKCLRPVYRRAGIAFTRGENTVEVTEEQLAIIRADSVLSVVSASSAETLAEAGAGRSGCGRSEYPYPCDRCRSG